MNRHKLWALGLAAGVMLAFATNAFGCTVCFGESDHPIVKGAEASVLFMVGVTYLLPGSGVAGFFLLRRRARRLAEQNATPALSARDLSARDLSARDLSTTVDQGEYRS